MGRSWVVACDEPGDAQHSLLPDKEDPNHDNARKNALWGVLMAGGAGIEWYFGYQHAESDLTCQDWRSRDRVWALCRYASRFIKQYRIPFWDMFVANHLSSTGDWVLSGQQDSGERVILVYLKQGGRSEVRLPSGDFDFGWFNPRTGSGLEKLINPGNNSGNGHRPRIVSFTAPDEKDWILLIKQTNQDR